MAPIIFRSNIAGLLPVIFPGLSSGALLAWAASIILILLYLRQLRVTRTLKNRLTTKLTEIEDQNDKLTELNIQFGEQQLILNEQHERLSELNSFKDRFFSIISHDLRGPINSMYGFSVLLKEHLETQNYQTILGLVDEYNMAIAKLSSLLENLLAWSLNQQGRYPFQPENLDLLKEVEDAIMHLTPMLYTKNIEVLNKVTYGIQIWADQNSVATIFRNILSNAVKFSPKEGRIEIWSESSPDCVKILFKDYGVGIDEQKIHEIFMLKEGKSTWGTAKEKGTGLGLSLVHDFVTLNKGHVKVTSKSGEGSIFTVSLPNVLSGKQKLK